MTQKHKIINMYLKGHNKSNIARTLSISRDTVRKYIKEYEQYERALVDAKDEKERESIIIKANKVPKYQVNNRKRYKITDEIIDEIKQMINENKRLSNNGQHKLKRKKIDMYEYLLEKEYDISYRSVCQIVSDIENKPKEAYVRQKLHPGEMAEFDWGDTSLLIKDIDQKIRRYKIAIFTLRHSNHLFARLYTLENTASFNDVHVNFFEKVKGVPKEVVYDNAKTAVKLLAGSDKAPTDALKRLSNYYGFKPRFTNFYSGHEKGAVERSVEYVRRKAFSKQQVFNTFEEANQLLIDTVSKLNQKKKQRQVKPAQAALADEQAQFLPKRIPLDTGVLSEARVNKYGFIYVDSNFYSVPDKLIDKKVIIRKYSFTIKVIYQDHHILTHQRIYGKNAYKVDILHYINTLKKKPGAIRRSLALRESSDWLQETYQSYYSTSPREFVKLLELIKHYSLDTVKQVINKLKNKQFRLSPSMIHHMIEASSEHIPQQHVNSNHSTIQTYAKSQLRTISSLYQGLES